MRHAAALPLVLALLAAPAAATWSIVMTDTATGEVAVGTATCLEGFNMNLDVPVIVVGKGGGAAQSLIDVGAQNRKVMFEGLMDGVPLQQILDDMLAQDALAQSRQYGIVDLSPDAVTFTGSGAGAFAGGVIGVAGTAGSLSYAIQGNVITGQPVLDMAEAAILTTPGPLSEKLMAGMEAARLMGGDGRCSCPDGTPTSCGSPPPEFEKSAHVGIMLVARLGDPDGFCSASGCASGPYWMRLNVPNQFEEDPDPVLQLADKYEMFKTNQTGRPDGLNSTWMLSRDEVVGTGEGTVLLDVATIDFFGDPLTTGGVAFTVSHAEDSAGLSSIGPVTDHGDGTYTIELGVGSGVGTDRFLVKMEDGNGKPAHLAPFPELTYREALLADVPSLSANAGGSVGFDLLGPVGAEGEVHLVLATLSGTAPGTVVNPDVTVPLNFDPVFGLSVSLANQGPFVGTLGTLDGGGAGAAAFTVAAGKLHPLVGLGLDFAFAWVTVGPVDFASNPVTVAVEP